MQKNIEFITFKKLFSLNKYDNSIEQIYKNENKKASNDNKEIINSIKKFKIVINTDEKKDSPKKQKKK